jgi:tetratricopeptide (TPR) repeat protein
MLFIPYSKIAAVMIVSMLVVGCGSANPTTTAMPLVLPTVRVSSTATPVSPTSTPAPSRALSHEHVLIGAELVDRGECDEAVEELHKAVEIDPDYDLAHYILGAAYYCGKRDSEAALEIQVAIELNPKLLVDGRLEVLEGLKRLVQYHLAETHPGGPPLVWCKSPIVQMGVPSEEEVKGLLEALERDPEDRSTLWSLAAYYLQRGEYGTSLKYQQDLVRVSPTASNHYILGKILQNLGMQGEAKEEYTRAAEKDPFLIDSHSVLSDLYFESGQTDKAIAHYAFVYALCPGEEVERKLIEAVEEFQGR